MMDKWDVYASSGEYLIEAENAGHAYLRFTETHPDDFVGAIVNREMQPPLVLQDQEDTTFADEHTSHGEQLPGTPDE